MPENPWRRFRLPWKAGERQDASGWPSQSGRALFVAELVCTPQLKGRVYFWRVPDGLVVKGDQKGNLTNSEAFPRRCRLLSARRRLGETCPVAIPFFRRVDVVVGFPFDPLEGYTIRRGGQPMPQSNLGRHTSAASRLRAFSLGFRARESFSRSEKPGLSSPAFFWLLAELLSVMQRFLSVMKLWLLLSPCAAFKLAGPAGPDLANFTPLTEDLM